MVHTKCQLDYTVTRYCGLLGSKLDGAERREMFHANAGASDVGRLGSSVDVGGVSVGWVVCKLLQSGALVCGCGQRLCGLHGRRWVIIMRHVCG